MARLGAPLAVAVFVLVFFFADMGFLNHIDPGLLGANALDRFHLMGEASFSGINYAMLAVFSAAIVLWITQAVPNYLTSLIVIAAIILTGILPEQTALQQLGHPVMWLNILSFIMAGVLVKTRIAKRFALWLVVRFGKKAGGAILSFMLINLVLSAFISATTAKAAILMPIFMVVAAVYGATGGENRNAFGKNLLLQNLFQINLGANGFITGSGATLLAGALIAGALGKDFFGYTDWLVAALPLSIILMLIAWVVGTRWIFPVKREERTLGAGLDATGLPGLLVGNLFHAVGITEHTPFWVLYMLLTGTMLLSALIFQSKTMQTLIFVPIAISVAQQFGYPVLSLAFPVALLIGHVYVLPFNSKPAALLYTSNHYSLGDAFRFGMVMMVISWGMIILWGETVLRWLGYTNGVFYR